MNGTQVFIEPEILEKYPDTFFEAVLSGRHRIDYVDGNPYIDRDPVIFEKMLEILRNGQFVAGFSNKLKEEFVFNGIDYHRL